MNKTLSIRVLAFSLLVSLNLFSQPMENAKQKNALNSGSFSIQFALRDYFLLTNFEGGTFAGKYHFNAKTALRAAVDIDGSFADRNSEIKNDTLFRCEDRSNDEYSVLINLMFIKYFNPGKLIPFYVGIGPIIGYASERTENERFDCQHSLEDISGEEDYWQFGLSGLWGCELFIRKDIGLFAEYGINFLYRFLKNDTERDGIESTNKNKTYSLYGKSVTFGVSDYL